MNKKKIGLGAMVLVASLGLPVAVAVSCGESKTKQLFPKTIIDLNGDVIMVDKIVSIEVGNGKNILDGIYYYYVYTSVKGKYYRINEETFYELGGKLIQSSSTIYEKGRI